MLDFHNHLIPGVDDGATTVEESMAGIEAMRAQGVTHVITTPHFQASLLSRPTQFTIAMAAIDNGWGALVTAAKKAFPDLVLTRGVELALDEPIEKVEDARIRLGGSRFLLVEFPYFTIPPNSAAALERLVRSGVTPIVAHPERYKNVDSELEVLKAWKRAGAYLQLNAGSIVGAYGARIKERAWQCLRLALVDYLCSDYHSRGQCLLESAKALLLGRDGTTQFNLLGVINGERLAKGLSPVPVPPLSQKRSGLRRLFGAMRRKR